MFQFPSERSFSVEEYSALKFKSHVRGILVCQAGSGSPAKHQQEIFLTLHMKKVGEYANHLVQHAWYHLTMCVLGNWYTSHTYKPRM